MSLSMPRTWLVAAALAAMLSAAGPAAAQSVGDHNGWQPGPNATESEYANCEGYIDWPPSGASMPIDKPVDINGWVVDPSAQGWAGFDAIHVYEGVAGQGGRLLAVGSLPDQRPDVANTLGNPYWAAAGFDAQVPVGLLQPGPTVLSVYAHSPGKGWWFKQVGVTMVRPQAGAPALQVESPKPTDQLKTSQDYTITGFALDPSATHGAGVDRIEVYIGGERGSDRGQLVGTTDVGDRSDAAATQYGSQFADAGWSVQIHPTNYRAGNKLLYVYARSAVTQAEAMTTVDINIVEK